MIKKKPVAIELFAGAGGLMLGLEMAGFHSIIANELHPDPCMTMKYNFPEASIVEGSIVGLTGEELLARAGYTKNQLGDIDLIAGGPPCQGFSNAGLKNPEDSRNTLIGEFIRMVVELRPKYFLLENVAGLVNNYEGKFFKSLLSAIKAIGYSCRYEILKASDYGVPQMRRRLIVLGARNGEPPLHPKKTHFDPKFSDSFKVGMKPYVTCGEALSDLPMIDQGEIAYQYKEKPTTEYQRYLREGAVKISNHQASKHRKETMEYYSLVPIGGTSLDIPIHLRKKKQGIQRWPLDGISRTITTEPTDFLHPKLNRVPTVRETARIQSFPDRFEFKGQRTTGNTMRRLGYCSQTQQVGNAVPPLLAKAIGEEIMKKLSEDFDKTAQGIKSKSPTIANLSQIAS